MKHIAVFISGGGTNLQAIIDACNNKEINGVIDCVISNKSDAYGLVRAKNNSIEAIYETDQDKILSILRNHKIDVIVLAGYLKILGQDILEEYENRIINIHPSLIPSFCGKGFYGMHVHEAVFNRGVKVTGATVHFVNLVVDGGPIIIQEAVDISDVKSPEEIQQKVLNIEHKILVKAIRLFCDNRLILNERGVEIL